MELNFSAAIYVLIGRSRILCAHVDRVALAILHGGQELRPLKVASVHPSLTTAFHRQSWRDSDYQMWELLSFNPVIIKFYVSLA